MNRRIVTSAALIGTGAFLLVAPAASAHVGVDKHEIVAGATTQLGFSFGHGCDGSATNRLSFQIPAGVITAQPQVHPGWTAEIERETLAEPAESAHGEPITERPSVITFTADDGNAVPADQRDTFVLSFVAPDEPGELFFKVIQGCESGETAWIEEWDGTGEEPEHPAPSVTVVAGTGGDDHGGGETDTTVPVGDHDDDGSSNGLAVAGLVVGGLGLITGGTALARGRKPAATS